MTDLESAEARAALARERLGSTVETLQAQLDPQVLIRKAKSGVVEGGERAVTASVAAAKRNPAALAGGVALIAAFFGRHRIAATARRLTNDKSTPGRKPR
ncbi:hypothetical protein ASG29_12975 [Sphingomonas sp. Leaf412]|uniref:DUF3618 domain-containing protein n=1 Tax=Sphingomonas sp. Leaf412 TaxID=1736370 RepID=UPI000701C3E6|nr:DUF3618 domain-containing protein [Sphingomonas sp. Leaf412]KQT32646.1 hypothetical protein ASG29_12975 [Sphingomonas sp. Leaf412]